jgi:hypothetical protein
MHPEIHAVLGVERKRVVPRSENALTMDEAVREGELIGAIDPISIDGTAGLLRARRHSAQSAPHMMRSPRG